MAFYQPGVFKNKLLNVAVEEVKIEEKNMVKPVEVIENIVWKKIKKQEVIIKNEDEVKPIKYIKKETYLRRKKYNLFLEEEWNNLWDMYDMMINYNIYFLDKARDRDDKKCFYDFTRLVFNNLKIYE